MGSRATCMFLFLGFLSQFIADSDCFGEYCEGTTEVYCPNSPFSLDKTYCCGTGSGQYCCNYDEWFDLENKSDESSEDGSDLGTIIAISVGSTIGAIVLLIICIVACVCCCSDSSGGTRTTTTVAHNQVAHGAQMTMVTTMGQAGYYGDKPPPAYGAQQPPVYGAQPAYGAQPGTNTDPYQPTSSVATSYDPAYPAKS